MRLGAGILFFFCLVGSCAEPAVGSIQDSTSNLLRWKAHFQTRFSFKEEGVLALWGGSIGYTWGPFEREVTLGYHWLGRRGTRQFDQIERQRALALSQPIYPHVDAGFINLGYWHIVHNSRRWKAGFPLEAGIGRARIDYYTLRDRPLLLGVPQTLLLVPIQIGGSLEWKATRWVGVGVQTGYRHNLIRSDALETLNGPFYRLRVIVYPAAFREGLDFLFRGKPLPSPFFGPL